MILDEKSDLQWMHTASTMLHYLYYLNTHIHHCSWVVCP